MMLDEQVRDELLSIFQVELEEHCQALTRAFLQLEKAPAADAQRQLLDESFRAAHSLKGAARSVGLPALEQLAHALEGVLGGTRRGAVELTPALFDLLYATVDTLSGAVAHGLELFPAAGAGGSGAGSPAVEVEALLRQLEAAAGVESAAPPASRPGDGTPALEERVTETGPAESTALVPDPAAGQHPPLPLLSPLPAVPGGSGETVRVPAARLDELLEQVGELVVPRLEVAEAVAALQALRGEVEQWQRQWRKARPRLRAIERHRQPDLLAGLQPVLRFLERNETNLLTLGARLDELQARLAEPAAQFGTLTGDLQAGVKRLRMLPFGALAETLERTVRDLARGEGKQAQLVLLGGDTELDRRVLEGMKDPLLHLLRNAIDHGIEPPEERRRRGKPAAGSVTVAAAQRGAMIAIEVADDGAGVDLEALRRTAGGRGLLTEAELATVGDTELLQLIFLPGLSTREGVSELSGRGVGLDVVARNVEQLGGRVEVAATPGRGTRFTITLPLTLAATRALIVEAAGALYALPTAAVELVIQARPAAQPGHAANGSGDEAAGGDYRLGSVGGRPVLARQGATLPVAALAALLDPAVGAVAGSSDRPATLALISIGAQRVALMIDRVLEEQEIVVKPLGYPLLRLPNYAGATILGSGRVVPILNVGDLVRAAGSGAGQQPGLPAAAAPAAAARRVRVLIVDDSLTTRTLERYILEAAGYEVELAGDGVEAYALLQERGFDVVVSDVEMPGLDGIGLAEKVRGHPKLRDLPVVLVTSLASPQDRERGLQAGADAYIVKNTFDQDHLLRTIRELV